jgi:DNA polymerase III epsilon subunit-like protein
MRLNQTALVALDFETTGVVSGYANEPWQIGLVELKQGCVHEATQWESYLRIDVTRPMNPHTPGRHTQLRNLLAQSPEPLALLPELEQRLLGKVLIAHNIATEKKVLRQIAPLHRFGPWFDTLVWAKKAWPNLASYKLESLIEILGLQQRLQAVLPERAAHDALYDAMAAGLVVERLCEEGWGNLSIEGLLKS